MPGYIGYTPQFNPISLQDYMAVPTMIMSEYAKAEDAYNETATKAEALKALLGERNADNEAGWKIVDNYERQLGDIANTIAQGIQGPEAYRQARSASRYYRENMLPLESGIPAYQKELEKWNADPTMIGNKPLLESYIKNPLYRAQMMSGNAIQAEAMKAAATASDRKKQETKDRIYSACGDNQVDVILGGPPCQGFSYAGWRDPNDQRNQLFRDFVDIVTTLKPKFFIMENVLGILTMRQGETIKEIIKAFADAGYYVGKPLKFNAADFGVPQKRKRVILIGCRENINIQQPAPLFAEESKGLFPLPKYISVREAIGSLPPIPDGGGEEEIEFEIKNPTAYDRLMSREITFDEFYKLKCEEL